MQGFAQQSLDGAIDGGVDALLLIPADEVLEWTDAPCINCGDCTDVCPVSMQVHLVGRYAEFQLFDQAGEQGVSACIECGLCAAVCPTRRPLLQLIRLAKQQQPADASEREGAAAGEEEPNEERKSAAA
jgi:electron transport complex protein RnfC